MAPRTDVVARPLGPRGVAMASFVGTTIEWYDFYVYSTSVVLILGPLFFPAGDPLTSSLLAFSTLGVGFLGRPLGGLVLAHFGDRVGRKNTLIVSLVLMGGATVAVGCLPTYAQIGLWAPIALVALRFVQGFAVGGEWGGAVLLAVEHAPDHKRAFYGAFPQFGTPLGLLGSSMAIFLAQMLPEEAFRSWGWRLPFLVSALLLIVGLVMRLRIEEPEQFTQSKRKGVQARLPLALVLRNYWPVVLAGTAVTFVSHGAYIISSFMPSYATSVLDVPAEWAVTSLMVAAACGLIVLVLMARAADGRDRRSFAVVGGILPALWIFPAFLMVETWGAMGLVVSVTVGYVAIMGHYAVLSSLLADQFPVHLRYTGISLCYQGSAVLGGGLLPILTSYLVGAADGAFWPAGLLMVLAGGVTVLGAQFMRTTPWPDLNTALPNEFERPIPVHEGAS